MPVDIYSDEQQLMLRSVNKTFPRAVETAKTASLAPTTDLHEQAFGCPHTRTFPLHTREHAIMSHAYAVKQAAVSEDTRQRITHALQVYDVDMELFTHATTKQANAAHHLLPQQSMGLHSPDHVYAACEVLQEKYAANKDVKFPQMVEMSRRLVDAAGGHAMDVHTLPTQVQKHAGYGACDVGRLLDWVDARVACSSIEHRGTYLKIAEVVTAECPRSGIIDDAKTLSKIASALYDVDQLSGVTSLYGHRMTSPVDAVYTLIKTGEETCTLAGTKYPLSKVLSLPDDVIDEFCGEGACETKTDPTAFKSMMETVPADIQRALVANVGSYLR